MITHTAAELARICGAKLEGDGNVELVGPASLDEALGNELSFARDRRFVPQLQETRAGAVIVPDDLRFERSDMALLRVADPSRAFSKAIASFRPQITPPLGVIDAQAAIDPTAQLGPGCSVASGCSVGAKAKLGENVVLYPGCVIGPEVEIGAGTVCYPNVVIYSGCRIGAACVLHAGCVIGSDGFGFDPTERGWEKVPQCGTVEIGSHCEIGANSTVDRGRFGPTRIGDGCKIDNLVHLAHNVVLEDGVLLVAQVGIAGSTTVRKGAVLGGQVGVGGHIEIGPMARVGAQAGVSKSIAGGKEYWGTPVREKKEVLRNMALSNRLPEMRQQLELLQERLDDLESREVQSEDQSTASAEPKKERGVER